MKTVTPYVWFNNFEKIGRNYGNQVKRNNSEAL